MQRLPLTCQQCLGGFALGVIPGDLFGSSLPWSLSGAPCYLSAGILFLCGMRGHLLIGYLCGCLAAAATSGMNSVATPWVLGITTLAALLWPNLWVFPRMGGVALYCICLGTALLARIVTG